MSHLSKVETLELDLKFSIELMALSKGKVLTREQIEHLNEKINGILNESGVVIQTIGESLDEAIASGLVPAPLLPADLVAGETYLIKNAPGIHHRLRRKKVKFLYAHDGGINVQLDGEKLPMSLYQGADVLEKLA